MDLCESRPIARLAAWAATLALATASFAGAPRITRPDDYLDGLLGREYNGGTALRTTGPSLWTSHPDGWGFATGVHYVHFNGMEAFSVEMKWDDLPVEPGPAYAESHLETTALPVGDLLLNTAGSGLPSATGPDGNDQWMLLDGDRRPLNPWVHEPTGLETQLELRWDGSKPVAMVLFSVVEDAERGIVLPDQFFVEYLDGGVFRQVAETSRTAAQPVPGFNSVRFREIETEALRIRFFAESKFGVAEIEAYAKARSVLDLVERKLVTDDDSLVVSYTAKNLGPSVKRLIVKVTSPLADTLDDKSRIGSLELSGVPVHVRLEVSRPRVEGDALVHYVPVHSGFTKEVRIVLSIAKTAAEAAARATAHMADPDPVAESVKKTGAWFRDNVPQLDVPDKWFEKMWAYRWQVARRNLADPKYGRLQHPTFMEGRWAAKWFPVPITYGAPHQLREVRWLRDPAYARGHALTFVDNLRADGAFVGVSVSDEMREYTDWISHAIWEVYLATGDTELLAQSLEAMQRNLDYVLTRDPDGDALPVVADHYETGMEWQPAFFYFDNYQTATPTPLERVDYAAALYGNAIATAKAAEALCDLPAEAAALQVAESVRSSVLQKMWDPATSFYYSLRETDDAMAMAREIVGFYPFAFGLSPTEHEPAMAALFDPAEFWTTWPPASSSLTCPATSMDGWPVGPGGSAAMWNGPTWPHSISVVADAIANVIRRSGETHATRAGLFEMVEKYTMAQFCCVNEDRDFENPQIGEYYHGWRAYWKTSERDYFHSTYADIIIAHVIGLTPVDGPMVRVDPLIPPGTWDRFLLDRVRYRGHDVTVVWDEPDADDHYGDGRDGLDLYIDDELVATRPDLGLLEAALPERRILAVKDAGGQPTFVLAAGPTPWSLYRAPDATLAGATSLPDGPFAQPTVTDDTPPPNDVLFYRTGACGFGL